MAKLTVPEGVVAISVWGRQFDAEGGVIDVTDAPGETVSHLINQHGCLPMSEQAEEDAAAQAVQRAAEKKLLQATLVEAGVSVDGRASLARLRQMVADLPAKTA